MKWAKKFLPSSRPERNIEAENTIAQALETPYGCGILYWAMKEPIRSAVEYEQGNPRPTPPIEETARWPKGIVPIPGETWPAYQTRIGDKSFNNSKFLDYQRYSIYTKPWWEYYLEEE